MEATVSYLLMLQKCINSKQKIQKKKLYPLCLGNILKDFTIDNMKKKECMNMYITFLLITILLIFWIFIFNKEKTD